MSCFVLLFGLAAALAVEEVTLDVPVEQRIVEALGQGARVDWTRSVLVIEGEARPYGTQSRKAVEQLARREVDARVQDSAGRVRVTTGVTLAALLDDADLGPPVRARLARWEVSEATYYASGRVALLAEVDLASVLKPWTVREARPLRPGAPPKLAVVLDATRLGPAQVSATPCHAMRVLGEGGALVFDGRIEAGAAVRAPPARWIRGDLSAFVGAGTVTAAVVRAEDCALIVDAAGEARLTQLDAQESLSAGQLWIVAP